MELNRLKGYIAAFSITWLFFGVVILYGIYVLPRGGAPLGYLRILIFLLPLSPLFAVWLYFMYRALIPVTGGMPARGFKQWALAYVWGLAILLYWALWAFVLDLTVPSLDVEYREAIVPLFILIITQLILAKSIRYQLFMKRLFQTSRTNSSD